MATESAYVFDDTLPAHADLRAKQFYAVKMLSTADCDVVSDDADTPVGILQNKPDINQGATIRIFGISKMIVDGSGTAIAFGDPIGITDAGIGIKNVTADAPLIGYARGASSASGDVIPVLMPGPGAVYRVPAT